MLPLHKLMLSITGKVLLQDPEGNPGYYVYQSTSAGKGNLFLNESNDLQLRKFTPRDDNPSATQQRHRARFLAAAAAWQALSPETQASYETRARRLPLTGYNLFQREYARANPISPPPYSPVKRRYLEASGLPADRTSLTGMAIWSEHAPGYPTRYHTP